MTETLNQDGTFTGRSIIEPKLDAAFRIAQDKGGDWWVWRRLSTRSWVTFERCNSEQHAQEVLFRLMPSNP